MSSREWKEYVLLFAPRHFPLSGDQALKQVEEQNSVTFSLNTTAGKELLLLCCNSIVENLLIS